MPNLEHLIIKRRDKMNVFSETPVNNRSLSKRKLTYGVGVNDADYIVHLVINGELVVCRYYLVWKRMIERCYSDSFLAVTPSYKGCSVVKEWHSFSVFKSWMEKQKYKNKELDKDILVRGNKVYGPDSCLFVDQSINLLLNDNKTRRGKYQQGVSFHKAGGKYRAQISIGGKHKHLGSYDTPDSAYEAYKIAKNDAINKVAMEQCEPLRSALLSYKLK